MNSLPVQVRVRTAVRAAAGTHVLGGDGVRDGSQSRGLHGGRRGGEGRGHPVLTECAAVSSPSPQEQKDSLQGARVRCGQAGSQS